ncbi:MAG: hypothetical protein ACOH1K_03930 [Rhodoglobus sp.]
MTYSAIKVRATPGVPRAGHAGAVVMVAGIALAGWISFGRHLFGIGGDLTIVYAASLGVIFAALLVLAGLAVRRSALRGFVTRAVTQVMLIAAGVCGFLLGLTIPDSTPLGLQTIISGPVEPALGIAIGIANPLGVIGIVSAIIALILAVGDSRGRVTLVESWDDDEPVAAAV